MNDSIVEQAAELAKKRRKLFARREASWTKKQMTHAAKTAELVAALESEYAPEVVELSAR